MDKIKVSVCISVHNTAAYLPRCLDSVLAQTLTDIEIVLVNNGSTDESESIMRKYADSHTNFKWVIVSQEDRGLAQGRQSGVNNACGDFIAFLDADDLVYPTAYEKLYNLAVSTQSDIAEMQTKRDNKIISAPFTGVVNSNEVLDTYFNCKVKVPQMLWLRIYKRKLFERKVLPELYVNNEDNFAFPCLLLQANQVAYLSEPLHIYSTDNEGAVMNRLGIPSVTNQKKYVERKKKAIMAIPHVINFYGDIKTQFSSFDRYISTNIAEFFADNLYGLTFSDKLDYILEIFNYQEYKELNRFVAKNIAPLNLFYLLVKILGLKRASLLYCILKHRNK